MTVFSFGAGQESVYLLQRILTEPAFRKKHVIGKLLVVGSNTGIEHPHTYRAVEYCRYLCKLHNQHFEWVEPSRGFHSKTWPTLQAQYKRNSSVGSAAFLQTCTDNLKVKVVDNYVEAYFNKTFNTQLTRKRVYYEALERLGKIRLILGFAKGEEHRLSNGNKFDAKWKKETVERHFPLVEEGVDRQMCIVYNDYHIRQFRIWPSNCMICFYQSDQEVLWLWRNYPEVFTDWCLMEKAKLDKYPDVEKNYGVYGKITLEQKLKKAQLLYGDWTDERLNDYKFSHGHCIKSKY